MYPRGLDNLACPVFAASLRVLRSSSKDQVFKGVNQRSIMAPKTSYTDDFAGVTNTSNSTTSNILNGRMPGSHFRDALPTASMVVAGMCFLFFLVIGIAQCIAGHRSEQKKRFKVSIGLSTFIMILCVSSSPYSRCTLTRSKLLRRLHGRPHPD